MNTALVFSFFCIVLVAAKHEEIFSQAKGPCVEDKCQDGHTCFYGNCVPSDVAPEMPTLDSKLSTGSCDSTNACPMNHFCQNKLCFPDSISQQ